MLDIGSILDALGIQMRARSNGCHEVRCRLVNISLGGACIHTRFAPASKA